MEFLVFFLVVMSLWSILTADIGPVFTALGRVLYRLCVFCLVVFAVLGTAALVHYGICEHTDAVAFAVGTPLGLLAGWLGLHVYDFIAEGLAVGPKAVDKPYAPPEAGPWTERPIEGEKLRKEFGLSEGEFKMMREAVNDAHDALWLLRCSHGGKILKPGISAEAHHMAKEWHIAMLYAFVYDPKSLRENPAFWDKLDGFMKVDHG